MLCEQAGGPPGAMVSLDFWSVCSADSKSERTLLGALVGCPLLLPCLGAVFFGPGACRAKFVDQPIALRRNFDVVSG